MTPLQLPCKPHHTYTLHLWTHPIEVVNHQHLQENDEDYDDNPYESYKQQQHKKWLPNLDSN